MNNLEKKAAFDVLVTKFGRKPKSHLYPLFNYFFIPQTKEQFNQWRKSIKNGVHNQDLLLFVEDYELIKAFSPETKMKLTRSKNSCRIDLNTFMLDVKSMIFI